MRPMARGQGLLAAGFLSPALISFSVFSLVPLIYSIYIAFTDYSLYTFRNYSLVGFSNFVELFSGPLRKLFFPVLGWNLLFAASTVLGAFLIGFAIASLLNNPHLRESVVLRGLLIIPWAMPGAITVMVWRGLVNESFGPINVFLRSLGHPGLPLLSDPTWAKITILVVNFWFTFPYFMTVCIGALQAIAVELYEVVDVDGGGWWARLRNVTLPGIWGMAGPLLIASFGFSFNNFNFVYLLTRGGPARVVSQYAGHTDILISFGYKMTLEFQQYAKASAMNVLLFLIVVVLSMYQMRIMFREVD